MDISTYGLVRVRIAAQRIAREKGSIVTTKYKPIEDHDIYQSMANRTSHAVHELLQGIHQVNHLGRQERAFQGGSTLRASKETH